MSDVVLQRLRACYLRDPLNIFIEAADKIEELSAALIVEMEERDAEIGRLREVLGEALGMLAALRSEQGEP